jgi:protein HOOK3
VISYIDFELKLPNKRFESIDLSGIARKEETKDLLSLIEMIVYATVNSPYKEDFIKTIMELDEECQTQFMYFIQKAMGQGDSPLYDPNIKVENRDVLILRTEKQRLNVQIDELLEELKVLKTNLLKVTQEKDDLQLTIVDLKNSLNQKPRGDNYLPDSHDVDLILTEKDIKIMQLTNQLTDLRTSNEKEISKLKDELDLATNKIISLTQCEKTLNQYKKRLESLSSVKVKLQNVEKQNEELLEQLEMKDVELENLNSYKKNLKMVKDDLAAERTNSECLVFKIDMMKKDLKKREAELEEFKRKSEFFENRVRDLENESSQNSEDSGVFHKLSDLEESCRTSLEVRRETKRLTINSELDQFKKERLIFQHKYRKSKEKLKKTRENLRMLFEEASQSTVENFSKKQQLESQVMSLSSKLQSVSDNLSGLQKEKFKSEQCLYELEQVKLSKENLIQEMKNLYQDKDLSYKKLLECREELLLVQKAVNEKDVLLRQKDITEKILNEKVQTLTGSEKMLGEVIESLTKQKKEDSNDYRIRFMETERELLALKSEKAGLLFRVAEKDERIEEILRDKGEYIKALEKKQKEALEGIKEENNRRTNQIISQCDEAITELQKERELLVAKLKIQKQSAIQDWKKSMNVEVNQSNKAEISKLKEEMMKKDKEIIKLTRQVVEIKKCWKDSSKLLKAVWKELVAESQKIQNASRRYNV